MTASTTFPSSLYVHEILAYGQNRGHSVLPGHQQRYFLCIWLNVWCFPAQRKDKMLILFTPKIFFFLYNGEKKKLNKYLPFQQSFCLKTLQEYDWFIQFQEFKLAHIAFPAISNSYQFIPLAFYFLFYFLFLAFWVCICFIHCLDTFLQHTNIFHLSPNCPPSIAIFHSQHLHLSWFRYICSSRVMGKRMGFRFRLGLNPVPTN